MALTDIVNSDLVYNLSRGNSGVLVDSISEVHALYITNPSEGDVRSGTVYGPQGSLSGELASGGGISRGRLVNA